MEKAPRGFSRITLIVTNGIKIAGLVLAARTAFAVHPSTPVLALAAFMMAGAQFGEGTVMAIADRFLGRTQPEAPPPVEVKKP